MERERRRAQTGLLVDLQRIRNAADRRVEQLLAERGIQRITAAQANALMVLVNARRPLTGAALARELGVSEVTVGRFLRAMEDAGWVERTRDPDDSRQILVRPTAQTRDALPRFVDATNQLLDIVFAGVVPEQLAWVTSWLAQARTDLEEPANLPDGED